MVKTGEAPAGNEASEQATGHSRDGYKGWFDLSILILAHLALFPVWLVCWTAIPLIIWLADRGPVFFRQERIGKNGKVFSVLKFRTMLPDANALGPAWTRERDPRVTSVGRVLRRTGLDELPQVLSIWKRDMTLVGPRALSLGEHQELEEGMPGFGARLQVLPGLTGLAQIHNRTDDSDSKFKYDLEYMKRMSPILDTWLLVRSVYNTLTGRWDARAGKTARKSRRPPVHR